MTPTAPQSKALVIQSLGNPQRRVRHIEISGKTIDPIPNMVQRGWDSGGRSQQLGEGQTSDCI